MWVVRKRFRVLLFAAIVAAVAVPVGFALSLESDTPRTYRPVRSVAAVGTSSTVVASSVVVAPVATRADSSSRQLPDAAKLFGVGTILFGLAAAVRRAI
jgi:hypothetical protein